MASNFRATIIPTHKIKKSNKVIAQNVNEINFYAIFIAEKKIQQQQHQTEKGFKSLILPRVVYIVHRVASHLFFAVH